MRSSSRRCGCEGEFTFRPRRTRQPSFPKKKQRFKLLRWPFLLLLQPNTRVRDVPGAEPPPPKTGTSCFWQSEGTAAWRNTRFALNIDIRSPAKDEKGFNVRHFRSTSNEILKDSHSEKKEGLKAVIMLNFSDSDNVSMNRSSSSSRKRWVHWEDTSSSHSFKRLRFIKGENQRCLTGRRVHTAGRGQKQDRNSWQLGKAAAIAAAERGRGK